MFPRLPARATFVADTNFVSRTQKMFLILFRNILCPQQMFPSLRSPRNIMGNNVSATMCPRLPGPLHHQGCRKTSLKGECCARGQTWKHLCRQQCVRNSVSSFARALRKQFMGSFISFKSPYQKNGHAQYVPEPVHKYRKQT